MRWSPLPGAPGSPRVSPLLLVLGGAALLGGCAAPKAPTSTGQGGSQELLVVSYAVTKGAYARILPRFAADWKAKTGQELKIRTSYGPPPVSKEVHSV